MAIPYHTHNFTIPIATKQDVEAGSSDSLVITPSVLGSAATQDIGYFATSDQGSKADTAVQPSDIGAVAKLDSVSVNYISGNGTKNDNTFLSGEGNWKSLIIPTDYVPSSRRIITSADGALRGGDTLEQDIVLDITEETKQKISLASTALQPKNVKLDDIKTSGTPDANKFLSGSGWKELTGGGDMLKGIYDPQNIQKDAFDMENMTNGASKFVYSAEDKNKVNEMAESISSLWSLVDNLVPVGTMIFFDGNSAPDGFLIRDGSSLKISEYPDLFKVLGTRYGGDGTTTFGIGDFRGMFIRGIGGNSAELGKTQGDAIREIWGQVWSGGNYGSDIFTAVHGVFYKDTQIGWRTQTLSDKSESASANLYFSAKSVVPTANENRPINIALLPCIKY